jgi:predicted MPP superfamily phosphohydrolase
VLQRTLRSMRAPFGKLAVRGNWDVWYWSELPLLRGTGFEWLDRRMVSLEIRGKTIHLLGWSYRDRDEARGADELLARLPPDDWRVFLHHTPDLVERVPSADLVLAGHTHGGQIWVPFYGALVTLSRYGKRFERGHAQIGRTHLYVNPGIGVEPAVPVRLGVRPEITLIELGRKR